MTVDIKENTLISAGTVKNCNSSETMLVTLIPYFLAATLEAPTCTSWNHSTEVTYLVTNNARTIHQDSSKSTYTQYNLHTKLTCQHHESLLFCHFHDVSVETFTVDGRQKKREQVHHDSWIARSLQANTFRIAYRRNGQADLRFSEQTESAARDMIQTLARLLIIGADFSKEDGMFRTVFNEPNKHCVTHFKVEQHAPVANRRSSIRELFFIENYQTLIRPPLQIKKIVEITPACMNKSHWYSFWSARGKEILGSIIESQLGTAENYMRIEKANFTSSSSIITQVNNLRDNTRYTVQESINLSLLRINIPEYPYCNDDNRHFHRNENRKYLS